LLTIVVDEPPGIQLQQKYAIEMMKKFPSIVAFATTFPVEKWNKLSSKQWQKKTIANLQHSFEQGAIAVKVYKNIGMVLRDTSGDFIMIDDPQFDPIFNFLTKKQTPVVGHLGEPKDCWLPEDEMIINSDKRYYSRHPEFHMYLHPEYPSYWDQINARDHMLEKHPKLRFVGAHLGSIEWSTDELAKRLDRFPNMAVDVAARTSTLQYLTKEDREKVRRFFIKYQDRLIYGTDRIANGSREPADMEKFVHETWLKDWEFYSTDNLMQSSSFKGKFKGLKLPRKVIDKLYYKNAEKWYPALKKMNE